MLLKDCETEPVLRQGVFMRRGDFLRESDVTSSVRMRRRREEEMENKWRNRFSGDLEERVIQCEIKKSNSSVMESPVMTSTPRQMMETLDRKTDVPGGEMGGQERPTLPLRRDVPHTEDTRSLLYRIRTGEVPTKPRLSHESPLPPYTRQDNLPIIYSNPAQYDNQTNNIHKEEDSGVGSIITNNSESTDSGSSSLSQSKTVLEPKSSFMSKISTRTSQPKINSPPKITSQQKTTSQHKISSPRQSAAPQKPVRVDSKIGVRKNLPALPEFINAEETRQHSKLKSKRRGNDTEHPSARL